MALPLPTDHNHEGTEALQPAKCPICKRIGKLREYGSSWCVIHEERVNRKGNRYVYDGCFIGKRGDRVANGNVSIIREGVITVL